MPNFSSFFSFEPYSFFVFIHIFSVILNNDLNTIVQKFSEHYHDAWASRKLENSWVYGEQWSDANKSHPRLKPYGMLNDYVNNFISKTIVLLSQCLQTNQIYFHRKRKGTRNLWENHLKLYWRLVGVSSIRNLMYHSRIVVRFVVSLSLW